MGDLTIAAEGAVPATLELSEEDRAVLRRAVLALERPSLAARLANLAGAPLDFLGRAMPQAVSDAIARATEAALRGALRVALASMPDPTTAGGTDRRGRAVALLADSSGAKHKTLVALSGAFGGAFGIATLPIELPLSTTIMLRAIAEIARQEGEDLSDPDAALACLQVFALGGRSEADNMAESGYFAVRGALARTVAEAARYVAERGFLEEGAPILLRFAAQIAARFGIVVSQKVAAQAVPVIGAVGGAAVNAAFMDHFQTIARAHFTVRRLERSYGRELVRAAYDTIRREEGL